MDHFEDIPEDLQRVVIAKDADKMQERLEEIRPYYLTFILVCVEHYLRLMFTRAYDYFRGQMTEEDCRRLVAATSRSPNFRWQLKYILSVNPPDRMADLDAQYWYDIMRDCLTDKRFCSLRHLIRYFPIDFEHRSVFWFNRVKPTFDHGPALNTSRIRLLHEYKFSSENKRLQGEKFKLDLMEENLWDVRDSTVIMMTKHIIAPWRLGTSANEQEDVLAYDTKFKFNHFLFHTRDKVDFLRDCCYEVGIKSIILPRAKAPDMSLVCKNFMTDCVRDCPDYDEAIRLLLPGRYREDVMEEFYGDLPAKYSKEALIKYLTEDRSTALDPVLEDVLWNGFSILHGGRAVDHLTLQDMCKLTIYETIAASNMGNHRMIRDGVDALPLPPAIKEKIRPNLTETARVRKRDYLFSTYNSQDGEHMYGPEPRQAEYSAQL